MVDEFNYDTTISAASVTIGINKDWGRMGVTYLEAAVYKYKTAFMLILIPQFHTIRTLDEGSKVYIKFTDSTVMQLVIKETSISNHKTGEKLKQGGETIWYNYLSFYLKLEDVMTFERKEIYRVKCSGSVYDVEGQKADIIAKMIGCIRSKE